MSSAPASAAYSSSPVKARSAPAVPGAQVVGRVEHEPQPRRIEQRAQRAGVRAQRLRLLQDDARRRVELDPAEPRADVLGEGAAGRPLLPRDVQPESQRQVVGFGTVHACRFDTRRFAGVFLL